MFPKEVSASSATLYSLHFELFLSMASASSFPQATSSGCCENGGKVLKKQRWVPNGADKSSEVERGSEGSKSPIFPLTWLSVSLPYRNELAGAQT